MYTERSHRVHNKDVQHLLRCMLGLLAINFILPSPVLAQNTVPQVEQEAEVHDQREQSLKQRVYEQGNIEPDRIYPLLTSLPLTMSAEYKLPAGSIYDTTEQELLSQFADIIVTTNTDLFADSSGKITSPYGVVRPVNLDPKLYGQTLHMGIDITTADPHKDATIFLNPIRARYIARADIGRLSNQTPITQVVDSSDHDLVVDIGGRECYVFLLYGHMLPLPITLRGDIVDVGMPLGDITKFARVGGSMGPHIHMEMIAVPIEVFAQVGLGGKTIQRLFLEEEYTIEAQNIYIDLSFILKYLPGSPSGNTGIRKDLWKITASRETKMEHYGEK